jgi:DNA-binding transcriptional regulator YhcF (GntR family)
MSDELRWLILRSGCLVPSSPKLSPAMSRLILTALADHADEDSKHFVSYRGLAKELALSPSTTFEAYKLFEAHRVMVRTGKRRDYGGVTEYQLDFGSFEPQHKTYKPLTDLSTHVSSGSETDMRTDMTTDMTTDLRTDMTTDLTAQARNGNGNGNETPERISDIEALFEQVLDLELEYRPSNIDRDKLRKMKRASYTEACKEALLRYPAARPATRPDRDLVLMVCDKMNPGNPALMLTPQSRKDLERRYTARPAPTEKPLTPEQIKELAKAQPLGAAFRKPRPPSSVN